MNSDELIKNLTAYETELTVILSRFRRSGEGIYIQRDDDPKLRQLVIELTDLLDDTLGANPYSSNIRRYYNEGVSGGPPSYASVESIRTVVSSVITRLRRNPRLATDRRAGASPQKTSPPLLYPDKVTIEWLIKHVPVRYWISFVVLLFAVFMLGIQASRINFVREVLRLDEKTTVEQHTRNQVSADANEPNSASAQGG